ASARKELSMNRRFAETHKGPPLPSPLLQRRRGRRPGNFAVHGSNARQETSWLPSNLPPGMLETASSPQPSPPPAFALLRHGKEEERERISQTRCDFEAPRNL